MNTATFDPLWVPLITHYETSPLGLDRQRTAAQIERISPFVCQFLIAGTTGDGWNMSDRILKEWLEFLASSAAMTPEHSFLVGAFGATTEDVISRAKLIEATLGNMGFDAAYAGLTVCAPVNPHAADDEIRQHFEKIIEATTSPIAIYQLPQVVGCEISPETLAFLVAQTDRITLFKDTSGKDHVIQSGLDFGHVRFLRGAEGDYHKHYIQSGGAYDGFLLSSANGLSEFLRKIVELSDTGDNASAARLSEKVAGIVEQVFAATGETKNAFADANRALDHAASGSSIPPTDAIGDQLKTELLKVATRGLVELQDDHGQ